MSSTSTRKHVVVGIDDRAASSAALDWAIDEASRRGLPLLVVHARQLTPGSRPDPVDLTSEPRTTPHVLTAAIAHVRDRAPAVSVSAQSPALRPAVALVDASRGAECLVVGTRGRSAAAATVLGSTSTAVAAHSECPVIVVRQAAIPPGHPCIVVGTDGSGGSSEAIGYAFEQASRRGLPLTAVHAWVADFNADAGVPQHAEDDLRQLADAEEAIASEELAGWSDKYPDVVVSQHVVRGDPVAVLASHSTDAELVVVGSRGRGGLAGMLMGSVSQGILHHAHCPVAVVRPRRDR